MRVVLIKSATVYYLNWDREREEHGEASDLFHRLHHEDPPGQMKRDMFNELYREVVQVEADPDNLEDLWRRWQWTGYTEGETFRNLRYCERCDGYIEGVGEAVTHAVQSHGYDGTQGEPEYVRGERSMSVGDVVEIDGTYYVAAAIGWEELEVVE